MMLKTVQYTNVEKKNVKKANLADKERRPVNSGAMKLASVQYLPKDESNKILNHSTKGDLADKQRRPINSGAMKLASVQYVPKDETKILNHSTRGDLANEKRKPTNSGAMKLASIQYLPKKVNSPTTRKGDLAD
eukprot:UN25951